VLVPPSFAGALDGPRPPAGPVPGAEDAELEGADAGGVGLGVDEADPTAEVDDVGSPVGDVLGAAEVEEVVLAVSDASVDVDGAEVVEDVGGGTQASCSSSLLV